MEKETLVSVIVPVYNVEKYLARCLDSIVGQTYKNLEIILVNDGSTDRSGEICRQYAQSDSRVRLFTQENQGLSAARNTGLDHMKGQYIVFVDSDDYISPYLIEILLDKLLKYDVPIAVCNYLEVEDGDDNAVLDMIPVSQTGFCNILSRDEVFDTIGTNKNVYFVVAHSKMYDKKIFETLRYPVGRVYEDEFIFPKVFIQIDKVCYVGLKLYAYRQSVNSITRKDGKRHIHIEDLKDAYLEKFALFQQYGMKKYTHCVEKQLISDLASNLSNGTDKEKTRLYIKEIEEKTRQITGKMLFSFRWTLFMISPKLYRFTRKHYLKAKELLNSLKRKLFSS